MRFEFRVYQRRFRKPLRTNHGEWAIREGILIRLDDRFGEITPLEWFGSESLKDAIEFCQSAPKAIDPDWIQQIPFPACQFGFESAFSAGELKELPQSALISDDWRSLWHQGYRTFKIKIGSEIAIAKALLDELPKAANVRLDANTGLTESETHQWLEFCDRYENIEFLEQPMLENELETMLKLSQQYRTPIALDESVSNLAQLKDCFDRGWRGIFVIKPAIAGFPSQLRQFCLEHQLDTVFSTVFETAIGRSAGLRLAAELSNRAVGYGTTHWFDELNSEDFEELWNSL
ncbi:MAG: o-succinylbenzoate synthase [Leptolyngbya sp. Prado105]|jgi:O-succinylbenzoate synthase|nr:o-succinylbenzoate synthase [Leptolyngbya sp. Prado105]